MRPPFLGRRLGASIEVRSLQTTTANTMATITVRVYLKGENAPDVLVNVAPDACKNLEALRHKLVHDHRLKDRVRTIYGDGAQWRLLNSDSQPLDMTQLREQSIVLLGTPTEMLRAPLVIKVRHQPHHNVRCPVSMRGPLGSGPPLPLHAAC